MQISTEFINRLASEIARSQLQQQLDASALRLALINPRMGYEGARRTLEDLLTSDLAGYFVEAPEAAQQPVAPTSRPLNRHERRRLASITRKRH